jgi:hypothetical protein
MLLASVCDLITIILDNWWMGCRDFSDLNEKCRGQPSKEWVANVLLFDDISLSLGNMFYNQGHFVFAYRYLESAEMLGQKKQTLAKIKNKRAISQKISYFGVAFIAINYMIDIGNEGFYQRITGEYNETLTKWTWLFIPGVFLLGICVIILVALIWICRTFRHDVKLVGSEKWMALHSFLFTIILISAYWGYFSTSYNVFKINTTINFVVYLLMAFILDKMNGRLVPKVTVVIPRPKIKSNVLMTGEFGEIDLATSMNIKTVIVDEIGDEPKVS